ncbi:Deoxyuridine 5'-triphosphate nucleotidohydrolase [Desulfonema limicola]|uniref:Deoxyuridine 5'-triphosphate nucleotidohydrolase n=1 Tax=Desulfonema limicola TaxID=45656 RepID=A0A975GEW0_9BACT|nr:dUTP diphosphatase [Desulfonema limicola]QTA78641.1 Deoxyuridine 5'-triphosphate nucleotidohydrolase [Desulfonema limicola]
MEPVIEFCYLRPRKDSDIPLPCYMTSLSAGMDICAAVEKDLTLNPGDIHLTPTGFAIAVPRGFEAQIRPRSGLALKHGITLINSPGTIDADYRGEVMLPLINLGKIPYTIHRGDRVAQMVINQIFQAGIKLVTCLDKTDRNTGGFGHTGL